MTKGGRPGLMGGDGRAALASWPDLIRPSIPALRAIADNQQRAMLTAMQGGWIYILTSRPDGPLYVGVTADIARRAWQHREGVGSTFAARYGLKLLVFVERHETITTAIQREKTLKHWPRSWKVALIVRDNPGWEDLYEQLA